MVYFVKKFLLNDRNSMDNNCNEIVEELGSKDFIDNLTRSTGLKNIFFTLSLTMVFFSMAGVPPLSGFFAKLVVLLTCISKK